jgi:hypothetical protein
MHPLLAEQFAPTRLAELRDEAQRRRLIRSTRPPRSRHRGVAWWRRDRA